MSGCGTSGRIAWLVAKTLNAQLKACCGDVAPCFRYLISGGDESLVISNELPEDDPHAGAHDLENITRQYTKVVFIGITCGLSAPYVAGQIEYSMSQPHFSTVLIGFNPVSMARNAPVENWKHTCRSVS
jgi:N-acetylmuramic acid 6-phosphate (MurNAc-6-P) etherase